VFLINFFRLSVKSPSTVIYGIYGNSKILQKKSSIIEIEAYIYDEFFSSFIDDFIAI